MKQVNQSFERGQQLVEFALILPVLLLLLLGIMEFGIAVFSYNTIANVGREVARYGSVHVDDTEVQTYIDGNLNRWTTGLRDDRLDVVKQFTEDGIASTIQVTVTYEYHFLTGPMIRAVGGDPILDLQAVTTMFTEVPYQVP